VSARTATQGTVRFAASILLVIALSGAAVADEATRLADDQWTVRSQGRLAVDGGLVMSPSMTLQTGMATGVGAGLTYGRRHVALGVRASWSTATESSLVWTVTHDDYRLRAVAVVQQPAGRGTFALRLGLGPSFVYEDRLRNQAMRAGLSGANAETTALVALPAADLEAVVSVHVAGPWLFVLGGGPSVLLSDGVLHGGWTAQLGAGWQP
jgi:hypothetical protein